MTTIIRNILACTFGILIGSGINMAIIMFGPLLIPPPQGVDVTNTESLSRAIHLFEPKHFAVPFMAHAIGTLFGSIVAFFIAASYKIEISYFIGVVFLLGGITAAFMLPAPMWFMALDLLAAYIPMAWLGVCFASRFMQGDIDLVD